MARLQYAAAVYRVERNRREVGTFQRLGDSRRHQSARTDFEEHAVAVGMHLENRLAKPHRLRPALGRVVARRTRLPRETVGLCTRIDVAHRFMLHPVACKFLYARDYRLALRGVEGAFKRKLHRADPGVGKRL